MSVLQDTLLKVSSAIIVTVDDLLGHREKKTSPNYKTLIPRLTDSIALIGHVHKELSFKRRDAIRPFLNQGSNKPAPEPLSQGSFYLERIYQKLYRSLRPLTK